MLCKKPYMAGIVPLGCGQCLPCRINRRRQWTWRQFFESLSHDENCFVTLTYDEQHLPEGRTLEPDHLSKWLKRFRRSIEPIRVRFFGVGEYGDETHRPHYHVSLFGVCGHTLIPHNGGFKPVSRLVHESWGHGFTRTDEFNELTAQYVSGYVTKKMTSKGDVRLEGRHPEFARMSNRPGIGAAAMGVIAATLVESGHGMALIEDTGDVPRTLKMGNRNVPLGRYLLQKLREGVGFTPEYIAQIKQKGTHEKSVEMLALFQNLLDTEEVPTVRKAFLKETLQKVRNVESRANVWKKRGSL